MLLHLQIKVIVYLKYVHLKDTTRSTVVIEVNSFQISPIKTHKGDIKLLLFVNKQLFWWSASITLDSNNDVLTDIWPFFSLYTLHTYFSCPD